MFFLFRKRIESDNYTTALLKDHYLTIIHRSGGE